MDVMVDIEALSTRPGAAIFELAATAFDLDSGDGLSSFFARISPAEPFFSDLETLDWHTKAGTWPREPDGTERPIREVLEEFVKWFDSLGPVDRLWSWGSTYDFPLLETAFLFAGVKQPYRYHRCNCARTVWNLAFPGIKTAPRPHNALADVAAAIVDLRAAREALREPPHFLAANDE